MAESGKKNSAGGASTKANKGMCISELGSITDTLVEKEHKFFELQFAQLHEIGKCADSKLKTTQTELASLSGSINLISAKFLTSGVTVEDNQKAVVGHGATLQALVLNGGPGGQKQALQQPGLPKRVLYSITHGSYTGGSCRSMLSSWRSYRLTKFTVVTLLGIGLALSFSASLARLFPELRGRPREGWGFFLFHSATLKIKDGSEYCVFNHPREVEDFLNSRSMAMQEKALWSPVSYAVSSHIHGGVPGVTPDRED